MGVSFVMRFGFALLLVLLLSGSWAASSTASISPGAVSLAATRLTLPAHDEPPSTQWQTRTPLAQPAVRHEAGGADLLEWSERLLGVALPSHDGAFDRQSRQWNRAGQAMGPTLVDISVQVLFCTWRA